MNDPSSPSPYYKLVNGIPVRCDDVMDWANWWLTTEDRFIARTAHGSLEIATSFVGFDSDVFRSGRRLFVTNILGALYSPMEWRTDTLEEAQRQHDRTVAYVRGEIKLEDVGIVE